MAPLPSKKEVLLDLLQGASVLVHLDARKDAVIVPKHLKTNAQLILQLGLNLAVPIPDLDVGDDDVRCTLSFRGTPFFCIVPFQAVFALVSEDGKKAMVWPEDVPAEVARAAEAEARRLGLVPGTVEAEPALKVKPEKKSDKPPPARASGAKREIPPYLRVIK